MKGAFEFGFILLFMMPIMIFGISFVELTMHYNQARFLQNYAITQIEHQNRYDADVAELIDLGMDQCKECTIDVTNQSSRYKVTVTFPIRLPLINYEAIGSTSMMSQIIK